MDLKAYFKLLDGNTTETLRFINDCSPRQLRYKLAGKWSIIEIMEHICITEHALIMLFQKPFNNNAPKEELFGYEKLKKIVVDNERKIQTSAALQPRGEIRNADDFEETFVSQRNSLKRLLESGELTIDNRSRKHYAFGEMTIKDWLNFIPLHAQRHLNQAIKILSSAESEALLNG